MALADGLITWIHLICASTWVGGSIFLGLVLAPMVKTLAPTVADRVSIMIKVGRRFNLIALPSLCILVITGIYNSRALLDRPDALFESSYGIILFIKIILVIATIITYAIHIKILNAETEKRLSAGNASMEYVQLVRSKIIYLGRITVILSIAVLLLAAMLDSGGL